MTCNGEFSLPDKNQILILQIMQRNIVVLATDSTFTGRTEATRLRALYRPRLPQELVQLDQLLLLQ